MNASQAAAALVDQLHAPRGSVTVLPRSEGEDVLLEVQFDDRAVCFKDRVPEVFEGYRTRILRRQKFTALFH